MPTYEYRCNKCGKTFEKLMTLREHENAKKPACPKCGSHSVQQKPAAFQTVTASKA